LTPPSSFFGVNAERWVFDHLRCEIDKKEADVSSLKCDKIRHFIIYLGRRLSARLSGKSTWLSGWYPTAGSFGVFGSPQE
jgi:hypothetical protein